MDMQDKQQALQVGRDPRLLPEYEALRAEINKLSHASRPEVDWQRIHGLCQTIFEKHGVDLQTSLYFCLARARLYGLQGFTEGCEFLANLIVTQWDLFWPAPSQARARVEMLDWFIARVGEVLRQFVIGQEQKRLVYRCERALQLISEKLHGCGLARVPRIENLLHYIEGFTQLFDETQLVVETDDGVAEVQDVAGLSIPPLVFFQQEPGEPGGQAAVLPQGSLLVGRDKAAIQPTRLKLQPRRRFSGRFWFTCGLLSCALPTALWWGWQQWQQEQLAAWAQLNDPAAALPLAPDGQTLRQVRQTLGEARLQQQEGTLVAAYQAQLQRLSQVTPLYWYQYGDDLNRAMQQLYPDSLAVQAMTQQWQRSLAPGAVGAGQDPAYLTARQGVDALLDRLLELERQHKSVTISYLKSQLYEVQKSLIQGEPLAERLSQLERLSRLERQALDPAQLSRLADELKALDLRLYHLQQAARQPG
ncbi:VasL domain-containing protein [Pseudaeromonas paramecii]|uniref:VasL domain-containing protein n=2 Tax=Pseudaeromonas paramecii TaxID=2138166 RepID=A0ABP8Q6Q1_9GAMM